MTGLRDLFISGGILLAFLLAVICLGWAFDVEPGTIIGIAMITYAVAVVWRQATSWKQRSRDP